MAGKTVTTPENVRKMVKLYQHGFPAKRIASIIGCSYVTVQHALIGEGVYHLDEESSARAVRCVNHTVTAEMVSDARRLLAGGISVDDVAKRVGVCAQTVYKIRKDPTYTSSGTKASHGKVVDKEAVIRLAKELNTVNQISEKLGVGKTSVYRILRSHKLHVPRIPRTVTEGAGTVEAVLRDTDKQKMGGALSYTVALKEILDGVNHLRSELPERIEATGRSRDVYDRINSIEREVIAIRDAFESTEAIGESAS